MPPIATPFTKRSKKAMRKKKPTAILIKRGTRLKHTTMPHTPVITAVMAPANSNRNAMF
jgi:hypothetical protein